MESSISGSPFPVITTGHNHRFSLPYSIQWYTHTTSCSFGVPPLFLSHKERKAIQTVTLVPLSFKIPNTTCGRTDYPPPSHDGSKPGGAGKFLGINLGLSQYGPASSSNDDYDKIQNKIQKKEIQRSRRDGQCAPYNNIPPLSITQSKHNDQILKPFPYR